MLLNLNDMNKVMLILFFLSVSYFPFAQEEVITSEGKKVILNRDGTLNVPIAAPSFHAVAISHLEMPKPKPKEMILNHTGYTLSYNTTYKQAEWVAYELTADETNAVVVRTDHFVPDPLLKSGSSSNKDYQKSGYDKGHLAPSADMCYSSQTMLESFYLSNMSPMLPGFNRGIWSRLEDQVRQWAVDEKAIYVVTGGVLTNGLSTIGRNKVTVPQYFYKVILDYTEPDIKAIGFIIPNKSSQELLQHYAVTIDSVEKVTNIDFFYQLPDDQEKVIESKIDINKWYW
jgi:endonuclease G, mitochondrial